MGEAKTKLTDFPPSVQAALKGGLRVELLLDKEGGVKAQTVSRKLLK